MAFATTASTPRAADVAAYLAAQSDQVKHALLFIAGLCWVCFVLLLILWDGKPRKEPIAPTVPANLESRTTE